MSKWKVCTECYKDFSAKCHRSLCWTCNQAAHPEAARRYNEKRRKARAIEKRASYVRRAISAERELSVERAKANFYECLCEEAAKNRIAQLKALEEMESQANRWRHRCHEYSKEMWNAATAWRHMVAAAVKTFRMAKRFFVDKESKSL